jgi:hypothetical protein
MPMQQWVREGNDILTNSSACYLRYTAASADPKIWSEGFAQTLAARLAADIAMAITDSATHMAAMQQMYGERLSTARSDDGRQGTAQKIIANDLKQVRR